MEKQKFRVESRYFILLWLLPLFWLPGFDLILEKIGPRLDQFYWFDLLYYYYYYFLLILVIVALTSYRKFNNKQFFHANIPKGTYLSLFKLTLYLFIFSLAAAYLLFYPLSYIFPNFVDYWYIQIPPIVYLNDAGFPFLPNVLSIISLIILPPLVEEYIFRGMLLHRLESKFDLKTSIWVSSLIFGLIHPDPIGAIVFGMAMCVLYIKYKTLWVPIFCHAMYNLLVWLVELYYVKRDGVMLFNTLENFQADLPIGVVCGIITIIWTFLYMRRNHDDTEWELPSIKA